ncbi:phage tail tape measure protein [Streptomyces sp. RMIT01]
MPRAGAVWVDVLPNMSRFGQQLDREIGEPVAQSSARAGAEGGESLVSGMKAKVAAGAVAVGAVVGTLAVKGLETSLAKGKAAATLTGQLSIPAADAKKAGEVAGKLWANSVTESVEEGAEAVKLVLGTGLVDSQASTKEIGKISTAVSDLATLFDQDVAMAAKAAASMVKSGFAKDGTEAVDAMTYGFQKLGVKAEDLAETFNEYSPFMKNFGLDTRDALGLMSQGLDAGAWDTDKIGDSFKELYLRITGGDQAVKDALKSIGLGGSGVMKAIADGGPGARKALDQILDGLRQVPDETTKARAVQDLFGGPGEDLGAAIFSLNVDTAGKKIGNFAGSAKKAGDALRSDVGTSFETFKRKSLMAIGDGLSTYVLPRLMDFGRFLHSDVLPKVKDFGTFVDTRVVPAIKGIGTAFMSGVRWVKEYGLWFAPLAVAIGGVTLAMTASSIATGITIGVMSTYALMSRGITAVTRGWAAAQALLNGVLALNPITLIIIGVVALGAALVVAYKKSETFRNIVQATWSGIKAGWDVVWNQGLKPGFAGLMAGLSAIGTAAMWLWDNALSPTFSAIDTGARILATIIGVVLVMPTVYAIRALGAVGMWLWDNALGPAFRGIGAGALWLYNHGIKPAGSAAVAIFKGLGAAGTWLWKNALLPAFQGIGAAALWVYRNGIKPPIDAGATTLRALGAAGRWLWKDAISPAFRSIGSGATWLYDKGIKPPIDKAKSLAKSLGKAFEAGADAIGDAMNSIKKKAKEPVEYVIDVVYNEGIRGVWNEVADVFGAPTLDKFPGFARGGVLAGQSSYRDGDDQLVPLRRGEGIAVSEAMRDPYERRRLLAVNDAAMHGKSLRPFQREGFAKGGIFDWVKGAASKGVDLAKSGVSWLKDGIKASAVAGLNTVVKPLLNKISGSASLYRDMIRGVPERIIKEIVGYSGKADAKLEASGIGGKGYKSALSWARTQNGLPYQWGGNGNPSWDCSGFMSAIESVIRGQSPHRRWATGAFSGATAPAGWVLGARSPFQIGITNSGVGHTAGTLNGVNVESRGGDGVIVGPGARSYKSSLFTHRYGLKVKGYATGGRPRRGEVAVVGEDGPELRVFDGNSRIIDHATSMRIASQVGAGRVAGMTRPLSSQAPATPRGRTVVAAPRGQGPQERGGDSYYFYPRTLDMTVGDLDALQRRKDAQDRAGRPR